MVERGECDFWSAHRYQSASISQRFAGAPEKQKTLAASNRLIKIHVHEML